MLSAHFMFLFFLITNQNQVGQDRFTPVQIVATYSIIEDTTSEISPVLDGTKYNNVSIAVSISNNREYMYINLFMLLFEQVL